MHAQPGDRLVVESPGTGITRRDGEIVGLHRDDGTPPCDVRWPDSGEITLIFPGPEAHVQHLTDEIRHGVLGRTLGLAPERVRVRVDDGAAALSGRIGSVADLPVIVRLCESVAGVVAVDPHLTCAYGGADLDIEPPRESPSSAETTVGREPT